jgi:thioredoxin 1|tara:strand:- start:386 stop:709 length:324 start_codon:yes stop_codon:yes gene_type:complete
VSALLELNDNNFNDEVIKSETVVLVDFWAEWCGPCKIIAPAVENISNNFEGKLKVGKLDVDSNPVTSSTFGIRSIPTLLIFKNGSPVDQIVGAVSESVISAKVENHI